MVRSNSLWFLGAFLFFALFYIIHYLTPMQSDDFLYATIGLDFENHKNHFLHWSGRLVADYISGGLLQISYKPFLAFIQTIAMVGLIYFIAKVPWSVHKQRVKPQTIFLLGMFYVLSNPNLGQTTFWVVGSANYMWTNLVAVIFLGLMFRYLYTGQTQWLALLLAVFAGCTNENLAVAVVGVTTVIVVYRVYLDKRINGVALLTLICVMIGAFVLIKSPGGAERLANDAFLQWRELSVLAKIKLHFFERLPRVGNAYLMLILLFWLIIKALRQPRTQRYWVNQLPTSLTMGIFLTVVAIMTNVIMVASPLFGGRSMSAAFCLSLMALAFMLYDAFKYQYAIKLIRNYSLFVASVFVFAYISLFSGYSSYARQEAVRLAQIAQAKQQKQVDVSLLRYHTRSMIPRDLQKDPFVSSESVANYYGFKTVELKDYAFDVTVLNSNAHRVNIIKNTIIERLDMYTQSLGLESVYVLQLPSAIVSNIKNKQQSIELELEGYLGNKEVLTAQIKPVEFKGHNYISFKARKTPTFWIKGVSVWSVSSQRRDNILNF